MNLSIEIKTKLNKKSWFLGFTKKHFSVGNLDRKPKLDD